jgi:hypothetical protein
MLGSVSAIDGASAVVSGGRTPLVESEGSNEDDIVSRIFNVLDKSRTIYVSRLLRSDSKVMSGTLLMFVVAAQLPKLTALGNI